jgi:hypothetical protein
MTLEQPGDYSLPTPTGRVIASEIVGRTSHASREGRSIRDQIGAGRGSRR